jgi:hypothetical protein
VLATHVPTRYDFKLSSVIKTMVVHSYVRRKDMPGNMWYREVWCGVVWRDWWRVEGGVTLVSLQSVIAEELAQAFISSLCCYDL